MQYFDLRRSDVDDDGASCHSIATELKWQQNLDLLMQCEQSTILRQLKFGRILRVIDVKGLGRPKEFTGREKDFQQWSKKTEEAFFAGVIKESEMMLEWAAEQPTEITTTAIDLEFLPTDTNEDRGLQNLMLVLQQVHTALMAFTVMRRTTLLPTRGRIRRRHGGHCRSDMIRRQEEEIETFCARSFLLDGALFWNSKRGSSAGSPACLATKRR